MPVFLFFPRKKCGQPAFQFADQIFRLGKQLLIHAGEIPVGFNFVIRESFKQRNCFAGISTGQGTVSIITEHINLFLRQREKTVVIFQKNESFLTQFGRECISGSSCNVNLGTVCRILCTFPDSPEHLGGGPPEKYQAGDQKQGDDGISYSAPAVNTSFESTKPFFACFTFCCVSSAETRFILFSAQLPLCAKRFGFCSV